MFLATLIIFESLSFVAFANDMSGGNIETHHQFNMNNFDLYIQNKSNLIIKASDDFNILKRKKINKEKEKLELFLEKYPASGNDFIIQACPSSLSRLTNSLSVTYNHGKSPINGTDYALENGDDYYVRYCVKDDPAGINQMSKVSLTVNSNGSPITGKSRKINSYYVHTWNSMSLKVSVGTTADSEKNLAFH